MDFEVIFLDYVLIQIWHYLRYTLRLTHIATACVRRYGEAYAMILFIKSVNFQIPGKDWKVPVPYYGSENPESNLSAVWESVIETHYEAEGYDGWYNNRAHPDWGGAGKICAIMIQISACEYNCTKHMAVHLFT